MKFIRSNKPVMLVEDDQVDVMTVRRAFKDLKITNQLITATNGEEALKILRNGISDFPCIILLDINMPKMNGHEFLSAIKKDDRLKMIPVIMLTTSAEEKDRAAGFSQNLAGYMIKPVDYNDFVELLRTINSYWAFSQLPD